MKKAIKYIHLVLSLPAGIVLTIICLTGAILVFDDEINQLINPSLYYVEKTTQDPLPLNQLIDIVNKQLTNNSVSEIQLHNDPERTAVATLKEGFRVSAFINPYSGEVLAISPYRETFFFKVMSLHRWLMDSSRTTGKWITGVSTIFMVVLLITGLILWFPNKKKKIKSSITIKRKAGFNRKLYDIHKVLGAYASIVLLTLSLTGLMWSFDWYKNAVGRIFSIEMSEGKHGGGNTKGSRHEQKKNDVKAGSHSVIQWDAMLETIKQKVPKYSYIRLGEDKATVLPVDALHERATDIYSFDAETNEIKSVKYYKNENQRKMNGWVYVLHTGSWGGWFTKIITFIAAIIGSSLPITGYWMFIRRIRKKHK